MHEILDLWKDQPQAGMGTKEDLISAIKKNRRAEQCHRLIKALEQNDSGEFI